MTAISPLSALLSPQVGALFQDAVDQLAVLGALAPAEANLHSTASETVVGDEVGSIVEEQRELELRYDKVCKEQGGRETGK